MQPLNDDNLDRLSREAADQFEMDTGAFGWERLEKRLTQELPEEEKDRRRFLFWLFFIVFVTGGGLLMMLGNGRQGSRDKAQEIKDQDTVQQLAVSDSKAQENTKYEVQSTKPGTNSRQSATATPRLPVGSEQLAVDEAKTQEAKKYEAGSTKPVTGNKQQGTGDKEQDTKLKAQESTKYEVRNTKPATGSRKPVPLQRDNKKPVSNNQDLAANAGEQISGAKEPVTGNKQPATKTQQAPDIQQPATEPAARIATLDPVTTANEPAASNKQPDADNQQQAASNKKSIPRTKQPGPLEIGLLFGPDWTYVNYWQSYKTGYNVGLQIGYRLNKRWSANTGLIYTKKNYAANGDDFNAPKHSYISYQDLRYLDGNCSMFEIPVNIRYDIIANKSKRVFASAGLTSYIMKRQEYVYSYYDRNNTFRQTPWATDSTVKHFFSVVNISAGYEWALNKKFSLQAEPYLKLPLKGLGYGTMRMQSMGLNLSIKYRPFFRK